MQFAVIKWLLSDLKLKPEETNKVISHIKSEIESFEFEPHFASFLKYLTQTKKRDDLIFTKEFRMENVCISNEEQCIKSISDTTKNDIKNIQMLVTLSGFVEN